MSFYILSEDNKIQSIKSETGKENWVFETGGTNISEPFVVGKHLYVAGSAETVEKDTENNVSNVVETKSAPKKQQLYLRSIGTVGGIPEWSAKADPKIKIVDENTDELDRKIHLGQTENDVFLLDSSGNLFFAKHDKKTIEWSKKFDSDVEKFFDFGLNENNKSNVSQQIFAFYGTDKKFYLITSKTGEILDSFTHRYMITSAALLSSSEVIIGDETGGVSLINIGKKHKPLVVWDFKAGAGISSLTLTEKGVLITSLDNFVYLINPNKGNRLWKKRLSGRLLYQPSIIENENIFIVVENESAYFISAENGAIVNRITLAAGNHFINSPVSFNQRYIFPTNSGIVAYSDSLCS